MTSLLVHQGDLQGQTIPLDKDSLVFGRLHDPLECDVVISKDKAVSGKHMRIFRKDYALFIEDPRSHNKTYLNGHKLPDNTPTLLQHNDRIRICEFEASYIADSDSTIEAALASD